MSPFNAHARPSSKRQKGILSNSPTQSRSLSVHNTGTVHRRLPSVLAVPRLTTAANSLIPRPPVNRGRRPPDRARRFGRGAARLRPKGEQRGAEYVIAGIVQESRTSTPRCLRPFRTGITGNPPAVAINLHDNSRRFFFSGIPVRNGCKERGTTKPNRRRIALHYLCVAPCKQIDSRWSHFNCRPCRHHHHWRQW